jgi:hypothetical protein
MGAQSDCFSVPPNSTRLNVTSYCAKAISPSQSCRFACTALSFRPHNPVISTTQPCHFDRATLSFRPHNPVISTAQPCHFDRTTLSFRPHNPVISTAQPCHFDRTTLSFRPQGEILSFINQQPAKISPCGRDDRKKYRNSYIKTKQQKNQYLGFKKNHHSDHANQGSLVPPEHFSSPAAIS